MGFFAIHHAKQVTVGTALSAGKDAQLEKPIAALYALILQTNAPITLRI